MLPPSSTGSSPEVFGSKTAGYLDVESAAGALRVAAGRPAALQPWKSFFVVRAPENSEEARSRLKKNILHFQANYLVLVATFLGLLLLSDWVAAIATLLVAGAWFFSQRYSAEAGCRVLALEAGFIGRIFSAPKHPEASVVLYRVLAISCILQGDDLHMLDHTLKVYGCRASKLLRNYEYPYNPRYGKPFQTPYKT
ncbi:PRA1D [Symbiodinium sp. CCMP2592]|nr:PRA1D [Symbiodinium sp. CCMP2592]